MKFKKPINGPPNFGFPNKSSLIKKPKASTNNGRRSSKYDMRPIRDENWIKDAKNKLVTFLQDTNYEYDIEPAKLSRLNTVDIRRIFEHIWKFLSSNFVLSESERNWGDRILKIFTCLGYPGNLTNTHFSNPSILSSVPIILAAFDYLRRLASINIIVIPQMMFPRIGTVKENQAVSAFESLAELYCKVELDSINSNLYKTFLKNSGLLTEEDLQSMISKLTQLEFLIKQRKEFEDKIRYESQRKIHLKDVIQNKILQKDQDQKLHDELQLKKEINKQENNTLKERHGILINKYEILRDDGTLNIVKSSKAVENKIDALKKNHEDVKIAIEKTEDELILLESKFDHFRLSKISEMGGLFRRLRNDNSVQFKEIFEICSIDDFLDPKSSLHSSLKQFEDCLLENITCLETQCIEINKCRDEEQETYKTTAVAEEEVKDNLQRIDKELAYMKKTYEEVESIEKQNYLRNKRLLREKEELDRSIELLRDELDELSTILDSEKQRTEEVVDFYECDYDFEKYLEELTIGLYLPGQELYKDLQNEVESMLLEWRNLNNS